MRCSLLFLLTFSLTATEYVWTGAVSTAWNTAGNWSGAAPAATTSADTLRIRIASGGQVPGAPSALTLGTLVFDAGNTTFVDLSATAFTLHQGVDVQDGHSHTLGPVTMAADTVFLLSPAGEPLTVTGLGGAHELNLVRSALIIRPAAPVSFAGTFAGTSNVIIAGSQIVSLAASSARWAGQMTVNANARLRLAVNDALPRNANLYLYGTLLMDTPDPTSNGSGIRQTVSWIRAAEGSRIEGMSSPVSIGWYPVLTIAGGNTATRIGADLVNRLNLVVSSSSQAELYAGDWSGSMGQLTVADSAVNVTGAPLMGTLTGTDVILNGGTLISSVAGTMAVKSLSVGASNAQSSLVVFANGLTASTVLHAAETSFITGRLGIQTPAERGLELEGDFIIDGTLTPSYNGNSLLRGSLLFQDGNGTIQMLGGSFLWERTGTYANYDIGHIYQSGGTFTLHDNHGSCHIRRLTMGDGSVLRLPDQAGYQTSVDSLESLTPADIPGIINIPLDTSLRANVTTNATFLGTFSGAGTFSKVGPGILTLTRSSALTGTVLVSQGELVLDGPTAAFPQISSVVVQYARLSLVGDGTDRLADTASVYLAPQGTLRLWAYAATNAVSERVGTLSGSSTAEVTVMADGIRDATLTATSLTGVQPADPPQWLFNRYCAGTASGTARLKIAGQATAIRPYSLMTNNGSSIYLPVEGVVGGMRATAASGAWDDPVNWSDHVVPGSLESVRVFHAMTIPAGVHPVVGSIWFNNGGNQITPSVTMATGATLSATQFTVDAGLSALVSGALASYFIKTEDGTLTLAPGTTFAPGTGVSIAGGTVIASGATLAGQSVTILAGATLAADGLSLGAFDGSGSLVCTGSVVCAAPVGQQTFSGTICESAAGGSLAFSGPGEQILTNDIRIQQTTVTGGSLTLRGDAMRWQGQSLTVGSAGHLTFDGGITLPATLAVQVDGVLRIRSGVQRLGGTLSVGPGATMLVDTANAAGQLICGGGVQGAGGVRLSGNGRMEWQGASALTGAIEVAGGVVTVTGQIAATGAGMTVRGGARLEGTGSVACAVTVDENGIIAPGVNSGSTGGTGVLGLGSTGRAVTFADGSRLACDLGTSSDRVLVSGPATGSVVIDRVCHIGYLDGAYPLIVAGTSAAGTGSCALTAIAGSLTYDAGVTARQGRFTSDAQGVIWIADSVPPAVVAVTSITGSGTYHASSTATRFTDHGELDLRVVFSEPVAVTDGGTLSLHLSNGAVLPLDRIDATTLAATYRPALGATTAPALLDVTGATLTTGAAITDLAGNALDLAAITTGSLTANRQFIIDNQAPVVEPGPVVSVGIREAVSLAGAFAAYDRETPDALSFSLSLPPRLGVIQVRSAPDTWDDLGADGVFTQAQLAAGSVRYLHRSIAGDDDAFAVVARDVPPLQRTSLLTAIAIAITGEVKPVFPDHPVMITAANIAVSETITAVDPLSRALTYALDTAVTPTKGVVTVTGTGVVRYAPMAGQHGTDTFRLLARPASGSPGQTDVTVSITGADEPGPQFDSYPPIAAMAGLLMIYAPVMDTAELAAPPQWEFRLTGADALVGLEINPATGTVRWLSVPLAADGYHRFGILAIDRANRAAAWQPILMNLITGGGSVQ